jgi:hypothetical protein
MTYSEFMECIKVEYKGIDSFVIHTYFLEENLQIFLYFFEVSFYY